MGSSDNEWQERRQLVENEGRRGIGGDKKVVLNSILNKRSLQTSLALLPAGEYYFISVAEPRCRYYLHRLTFCIGNDSCLAGAFSRFGNLIFIGEEIMKKKLHNPGVVQADY